MPDRPEAGLIQRPDLMYRLQQFLGLRQDTVLPQLNEGVQAVVIIGDVREESREKVIERPCSGIVGPITSAFDFPECYLRNPVDSGVLIRVQGIEFTQQIVPVTLIAKTTDGTTIGRTVFRDAASAAALTGETPRGVISWAEVAAFDPNTHYAGEAAFTCKHPYAIAGAPSSQTGWVLYPGMALRGSNPAGSGSLGMSVLWTESRLAQ